MNLGPTMKCLFKTSPYSLTNEDPPFGMEMVAKIIELLYDFFFVAFSCPRAQPTPPHQPGAPQFSSLCREGESDSEGTCPILQDCPPSSHTHKNTLRLQTTIRVRTLPCTSERRSPPPTTLGFLRLLQQLTELKRNP